MEARSVAHFLAVHDTGTFSGAAKMLGLSQQALSKSIARLEQQLGVRLFERHGHGARPTAFAELYLPHARAIYLEGERFRAQLRDALGNGQGVIRIGVGPTAASGIVADAVARLSVRHPTVRVSVTDGLYEVMCEGLLTGQFDIIVGNRLLAMPDPLILEEELGTARYIVVAAAGHPLGANIPPSLDDLAKARWVTGSNVGDVSRSVFSKFEDAGLDPPTTVIQTTSTLFTLSMLRSGHHVGILPYDIAATEIEAGRLIDLRFAGGRWTRPVVMAYRPASTWLPVLRELMAELKQLQDVSLNTG